MINPLGELDRLLRGLCYDSDVSAELSPETVAEIQDKLNVLKVEYEKIASELKTVILLNIKDREQLDVLKLRYAEDLDWDDVINAIGYSSRTVYRYHSKALSILDSIRYSV